MEGTSMRKRKSSADVYPPVAKFPASCRFIEEKQSTNNGTVNAVEVATFLKSSGLLPDDPRLKSFFNKLMTADHEYRKDITPELFAQMLSDVEYSTLIERAFKGNLVVPDFKDFCSRLQTLFNEVKSTVSHTAGKNADYIPKLAQINPEYFGMSVCTIDGQRFQLGDANIEFSVQSCCKPLTYCLALEEHGTEKVHEHIGREPSGVAFNSLCLNSKNRPHNPMINAGAIMACSLIKPDEPIYEKFQYGKKAFPPNTDLNETLDFYFQCCSLETDCNKLAIAGATLANMGECPTTGVKVLKSRTCRDCLSLMYSCGLYDYSGEWAFKVGIPAKSGVSGSIYAVIPDFGCICIYSPPLDSIGNSVRGVEFFTRLVDEFIFHNFDSLKQTATRIRINPRLNKVATEREGKMAALNAAAEGDLMELLRLIRGGVSPASLDYDGRTLLHLATCSGKIEMVRCLLKYPEVDVNAKDRWGGTGTKILILAYTDAVKYSHKAILELLEEHTGTYRTD
ncbi:hypothetical protein HDV06_002543 [Boothiomyces sp. JEL0866]|nr:hypothetical protein HDV06_002543 [Boothiomyces sp. JEL0866]